MPNKNYNQLTGAKTLTRTAERLLRSCGALGGQDLRCVNQQPWGQKLATISPFQG